MKEINVDLYNDFGNKSEEYDNYLIKIGRLFKGTEFYDSIKHCIDNISDEEDRIQEIIDKYLEKQKSNNE